MKIYCKDEYNSFKDLMMAAYVNVFKDEKVGFTVKDATLLELFGIALDILRENLEREITNVKEE